MKLNRHQLAAIYKSNIGRTFDPSQVIWIYHNMFTMRKLINSNSSKAKVVTIDPSNPNFVVKIELYNKSQILAWAMDWSETIAIEKTAKAYVKTAMVKAAIDEACNDQVDAAIEEACKDQVDDQRTTTTKTTLTTKFNELNKRFTKLENLIHRKLK